MNWQTIYKHLKSKGFDVYSLGQHTGNCTNPYVVLRNNGIIANLSVSDRRYEILGYVPVLQYSKMESFMASIKDAMNDLYPAVSLTEDESAYYLDDDVKAYMSSLEYRAPAVSKYIIRN